MTSGLSMRIASGLSLLVLSLAATAAGQTTEAQLQQALAKLDSDELEERLAAVELLGRRGRRLRDQLAPRLIRLLREDPEWRVRASSGRAIGRLGIRDAVPALVASLRDARAEIRVVAAAALWRLPDPAAVAPLLEVLSDSDAAVRQWAAVALGVIADRRATTPLLGLLDDASGEVRTDVLRSLARIADPAARERLKGFATEGRRPRAERLEAVNAIVALEGAQTIEALVDLLNARDPQIRARAARGLGMKGGADQIEALQGRLRRERNRDTKAALRAAIQAISERGAD